MKLYKNQSKWLLSIKTPRRMNIDPGVIIDIDMFPSIAGTDIQMYIDRDVLVAVRKAVEAPVVDKSVETRPILGNKTEVVKGKEGITVRSTVKEEENQLPKSIPGLVVGTMKKEGVIAIVAPPDMPENAQKFLGPSASANEHFNMLPQDIKEKVEATAKKLLEEGSKAPVIIDSPKTDEAAKDSKPVKPVKPSVSKAAKPTKKNKNK